MYLVKINDKTNLVDITDVNDGVLAIKDFADVINDPELGLECFTCIALAMDHASPIRFFSTNERPIKAMRMVTGRGDTYQWNQDIIMRACGTYQDLQQNPILMEISMIQDEHLSKLDQIQNEQDEIQKNELWRQLDKIKDREKKYSEGVRDSLLEDSESKKGQYKLTRLEQLLKNRKSFYYVQQKRESEKQRVKSGSKNKSGSKSKTGKS